MLKCFNNSIFVSIRFFNNSSNLVYNEILAIQDRYSNQGNSKRDILEYANRIENLIEETFRLLLLRQIILTEQSLEDTMENTNSKSKQYIIGDIKGTTIEARRYVAKIFVKEKPFRQFTQDTFKEIQETIKKIQHKCMEGEERGKKSGLEGVQEKSKVLKNEFIIEFQATKDLLCVKYVTNIELNLENTDVMVSHCNYMSSNWNNISLEFV